MMQTIQKFVSTRGAAVVSRQPWVMSGLALILGMGIVLRGVALGYDLPNIYHPDEPVYVNIIQRIYQGDPNPHFYNYPTLFFYLNALVYLPYFGISRLLGHAVEVLPSVSLAMGTTLAQTPEAVLVSRSLSGLFGLGSVALLFLIGRNLTGSSVAGLLSALLLAISPTAVKISRFITPDTFVVFFIMGTVYFSLRLYRNGRRRDYLLAGICAGLAASSKYNAGLVVMAPLIAHFMRYGWNGLVQFEIYRAIFACGLAFLFTSPFILLDAPEFWKDFTYEAQHYSSGHAGMEGDTLNWYLTYLWKVEGVGVVLGAIALLVGFVRSLPSPRRGHVSAASTADSSGLASTVQFKEWLVVFGFPVLYFLFISRFIVRNDRTLLPVIPFLLLAAAMLLSAILRRAGTTMGSSESNPTDADLANGARITLGLGGIALALAVPVLTFAQYVPFVNQPVPEVQAREWIGENLPPGTQIAIESYAPYLDKNRYQISSFYRAIDKDASWYRNNGFEYIVLAKAMFGRFYCDPVRYSIEMEQYERLLKAFDEVIVFSDPVTTGPVTALTQRLGDQTLCSPHAGLIYMHEIRILKVQ